MLLNKIKLIKPIKPDFCEKHKESTKTFSSCLVSIRSGIEMEPTKSKLLSPKIFLALITYLLSTSALQAGDPLEHVCGIRAKAAITGLVFKGTALKRGEFPW